MKASNEEDELASYWQGIRTQLRMESCLDNIFFDCIEALHALAKLGNAQGYTSQSKLIGDAVDVLEIYVQNRQVQIGEPSVTTVARLAELWTALEDLNERYVNSASIAATERVEYQTLDHLRNAPQCPRQSRLYMLMHYLDSMSLRKSDVDISPVSPSFIKSLRVMMRESLGERGIVYYRMLSVEALTSRMLDLVDDAEAAKAHLLRCSAIEITNLVSYYHNSDFPDTAQVSTGEQFQLETRIEANVDNPTNGMSIVERVQRKS